LINSSTLWIAIREMIKEAAIAEVVGSNPTRSIFSCYRNTALI
jgi:hypothetical protein